MIVGDLDIPGRAIAPYKAEPPLIVDANAVLALTIAAQSLQTVTGRHPQIVQLPGGINAQKLRAGAPLNLYRKPSHPVARKDRSRYVLSRRRRLARNSEVIT